MSVLNKLTKLIQISLNITKFRLKLSLVPVLLLASLMLINHSLLPAEVGEPAGAANLALMGAARWGCAENVARLLVAGADVNARDNHGNTALMLAARQGHVEIVAQLLAAGADVNVSNYVITALLEALGRHNTAIVTQLLAAGAEIPADLRTDAAILAQPETLRTTPALIRALNSGYHKQVIKVFTDSDIATVLATSDLRASDFAQHKFIINPGVQILPDLDLIATGRNWEVDETSSEFIPEEFSILDLAVLSCQPALVDLLLMSGMSPKHLTAQTRKLLDRFPAPDGGAHVAHEAKSADAHAITTADAESEQIAHRIYYAGMALTDEVQNRVRGLPSSFSIAEPLPDPVIRYAKATKEFQAWAEHK